MTNYIKALIFVVSVVVAITASALGFIKLPRRVDKVEEKDKEQDKATDKLANTVDRYILRQELNEKTQEIRDKAQERREKLMLEMIKNSIKKFD